VCVDDKFPLGIEKFYTVLPKAGVVYVIREMCIGISLQGEEGEVCVLLKQSSVEQTVFPRARLQGRAIPAIGRIDRERCGQRVGRRGSAGSRMAPFSFDCDWARYGFRKLIGMSEHCSDCSRQ
jgi:hypothetical protein